MNEPVVESTGYKPWYRRELVFFIAGSIVVAFLLVVVSMALYTSSGASLLDLSRPGYKSVQSEVDRSNSFEAFSADGPVTKDSLEQFKKSYQKQIKPVSSSSDFDATALAEQSLGIDEPPAGE